MFFRPLISSATFIEVLLGKANHPHGMPSLLPLARQELIVRGRFRGDYRRATPAALSRGGLTADDIVSLDHRGDADALAVAFELALHPHHLPLGANINLGAACDLGGKRQGDVQLGASREIMVYHEINAAGGNVASLATAGTGFFVDGNTDDDRQ